MKLTDEIKISLNKRIKYATLFETNGQSVSEDIESILRTEDNLDGDDIELIFKNHNTKFFLLTNHLQAFILIETFRVLQFWSTRLLWPPD